MGAKQFRPAGWRDDRTAKGWLGPEPAVPARPPAHSPPAALDRAWKAAPCVPLPRRRPRWALETAPRSGPGQDVADRRRPRPCVRDFLARQARRPPCISSAFPDRARSQHPHLGRPRSFERSSTSRHCPRPSGVTHAHVHAEGVAEPQVVPGKPRFEQRASAEPVRAIGCRRGEFANLSASRHSQWRASRHCEASL